MIAENAPRDAAIPHIVFAPPKCSGQQIMPRFTNSLSAGIVIAVLGQGAAFTSALAAPTLSEADDRAIKEAIASCKAEVKAKKIRFPASRTYLRDCVTETIRNNSAKR
jgi:hypothetical protein